MGCDWGGGEFGRGGGRRKEGRVESGEVAV